uniref:Uncharacterized protein n=1 Tax=Clastoptera arizonana TaxID=38151 RepID=A0A1B6DDK9_9HEMI
MLDKQEEVISKDSTLDKNKETLEQYKNNEDLPKLNILFSKDHYIYENIPKIITNDSESLLHELNVKEKEHNLNGTINQVIDENCNKLIKNSISVIVEDNQNLIKNEGNIVFYEKTSCGNMKEIQMLKAVEVDTENNSNSTLNEQKINSNYQNKRILEISDDHILEVNSITTLNEDCYKHVDWVCGKEEVKDKYLNLNDQNKIVKLTDEHLNETNHIKSIIENNYTHKNLVCGDDKVTDKSIILNEHNQIVKISEERLNETNSITTFIEDTNTHEDLVCGKEVNDKELKAKLYINNTITDNQIDSIGVLASKQYSNSKDNVEKKILTLLPTNNDLIKNDISRNSINKNQEDFFKNPQKNILHQKKDIVEIIDINICKDISDTKCVDIEMIESNIGDKMNDSSQKLTRTIQCESDVMVCAINVNTNALFSQSTFEEINKNLTDNNGLMVETDVKINYTYFKDKGKEDIDFIENDNLGGKYSDENNKSCIYYKNMDTEIINNSCKRLSLDKDYDKEKSMKNVSGCEMDDNYHCFGKNKDEKTCNQLVLNYTDVHSSFQNREIDHLDNKIMKYKVGNQLYSDEYEENKNNLVTKQNPANLSNISDSFEISDTQLENAFNKYKNSTHDISSQTDIFSVKNLYLECMKDKMFDAYCQTDLSSDNIALVKNNEIPLDNCLKRKLHSDHLHLNSVKKLNSSKSLPENDPLFYKKECTMFNKNQINNDDDQVVPDVNGFGSNKRNDLQKVPIRIGLSKYNRPKPLHTSMKFS